MQATETRYSGCVIVLTLSFVFTNSPKNVDEMFSAIYISEI